ncbi:MAG: 5-deoxy-glucuronate isomerase [Nocardioidaceae bacterium]|nr:5-deoxy-glucuronate isomerase [Nocardioidaceae bacterium]
MNGYHRRAGTTSSDGYALDVTPADAGWAYCGLRVLELTPGEAAEIDTGEAEALVLPLSGSATVGCDGVRIDLAGRTGVFSGVSDVAYLPRDAHAVISSAAGGRFALPSAVCEQRREVAYVPADRVPVELRGAGRSSRQVHNFGTPGVLDAERLICCEVLTPAGNWSSFPPHKHDEDRVGESVLEEIYYFHVADGPHGPGVAYQRAYGHDHADIDVLVEVRDGDVVLIPYGWHGPSMAVPGYDLYYLNVMAGPGERAWRICDDPAHAWVRDTWEHEDVDPRLPFPHPPNAEPDVSSAFSGVSPVERQAQRMGEP